MPFARELGRYGYEAILEKLHDDNGYVQLNREIDLPTGVRPLYLSISLLRQLAARIPEIGLVPTEKLYAAQREIDQLRFERDQLLAERDDLAAKHERILGVSKDGFKIQRQQGRPPQKKVAA